MLPGEVVNVSPDEDAGDVLLERLVGLAEPIALALELGGLRGEQKGERRLVQKLGRAARYVDDASARVGPAIVDAQSKRAPVLEIRHADHSRHRQCPVRGRKGVHVVALAVRCRLAVKVRAVPRGDANLC